MTTVQPNLIQLAKQGDAKAIAALLNRSLQPKGIMAKVAIKEECLQVMLEAKQTPNQQALVSFLQKGIVSLELTSIKKIKIYGKQFDENFPEWHEEFEITTKTKINSLDLAKKGDINAVSNLINQWLKPFNIDAKCNLKNHCLQVMIEASQVPDRRAIIPSLIEKIKGLDIQGLCKIKIYGKQSDEEFPDWHHEIDFSLEEPCNENIDKPSLSSSSISKTEINGFENVSDSLKVSNELYSIIQKIYYQSLNHRIERDDDDRSIHEIVTDFSNGLEVDLRLTIEQVGKQVAEALDKNCGIQLCIEELDSSGNKIFSNKLPNLRVSIRQLERVNQEVLAFEFPQESEGIKDFFTGAANEFSANLIGKTTMSQEMFVGATIGSFLAPGVGTVIGGAIGGWLSGNKKQKEIQAILTKYEKARQELFNEWELILQEVYEEISYSLQRKYNIKLLSFESFKLSEDFFNKGNASFEKQNLDEATDLFERAIQINPLFAMAWNNKGYSLQTLELYEEAIEAYDKAIEIDGFHVLALTNRADALQITKRHLEAIETYRKVIEINPRNFWVWISMGSSFHSLKQYNEALETCDKAIEIDPDNYIGWYARACCMALLGESKKALDFLERAVKINAEESQKLAMQDSDFDSIRNNDKFRLLMESSVGIDYSKLKEALAEKNWREADKETARVMHLAIKNLTNLNQIPSGLDKNAIGIFPLSDLITINNLWLKFSDGKYGFTVQKSIYEKLGGTQDFNGQIRDAFGDITGWRVKDSSGYSSWRDSGKFEYSFSLAPKGHLPSSLWANEGFLENSRDRLIALFSRFSEDVNKSCS